MRPTQRIFKDIEDGEKFRLYVNDETHEFKLISDGSEKFAKGTEVNGWYSCAHTGVTIRLNNAKEIKLSPMTFYNLKEDEEITHRKYLGFKRFVKI